MTKHTQTPWRVSSFERAAAGTARVIMGDDGFSIAHVMDRTHAENEADAAFICEAVNAYDALLRRVAVLEMVIRQDLQPVECSDDLNKMIVEDIHKRFGGAVSASWMPIETAPRDGTRILARGGALDDIEIVSYSPNVGAWATPHYTLDDRDDEPEGYNRPRFWMPLPDASPVPSTDRGGSDVADH